MTRHVRLILFALIIAVPGWTADRGSSRLDDSTPVATIVLDAPSNASALSLAALRTELAAIPDLGHQITWVNRSDVGLGRQLERPVQVRLRGRCHLNGLAPDNHQPGPFAWAHVVSGRVLPFVEVDCDRVRGALFSVMWGEDFQQRDFLFARAVARVLAHELHHVLFEAAEHAKDGLARPQITAANLIRGDTARLYSGFRSE